VIETERSRAVVAKLMTILSGDTPIETGVELMAPGVVAHVDGWRFEGINVWANWIRYLHTRGRVGELTVVVDRMELNADATITVRGHWTGICNGRPVTSSPCMARYRLAQGRIVEIWSTRRNYTFLCGRHVEYRLGLALEFLRVRRWKTRTPQLDLTSQLSPAECGCDVRQDRFDDVGVVLDTERVRHGQQQRVRFGDGLVASKLFD